ncbi:MAG: tripartite tricarboxylate transporter TctB family protein [Albidovulum sp.]|nr:tripartite tricarboxylate transporter TctB family protein [Albidovulum sp.]MDE0305436.1 tripartite tricarboxylate transporter TctB family protein [Albidovulum sp.]MDE0532308.1 tripartite tricarboxylate transporter TctB family protein [Albidovulum sp.]
MRLAELVTATAIALLSVYLMWKSGEGPSWDPTAQRFANIGINIDGRGPGSGFWPFWLSAAMFLASLAVIFNWATRRSRPSRSDDQYLDAEGKKMLVQVGGGLFAFLGLIHFLGYYGAIFLFLIYSVYYIGRHKLRLTLAVSVAVPVFCFFFFDIAMRIVLPKGYLEPLFLPLYEIFY